MKTPMALSVTSSQREQTSLRSQAPRLPRSNVCSTRDLENPSASVHLKRFSTPSLTLKFLCAGKLNPRKPKLHHVTFKTSRLDDMIAWYETVIGTKVQFKDKTAAWMTNDEANHRIAFLAVPGLSDDE